MVTKEPQIDHQNATSCVLGSLKNFLASAPDPWPLGCIQGMDRVCLHGKSLDTPLFGGRPVHFSARKKM